MLHPAFRELMLQENRRNLDRKLRQVLLREVPAEIAAAPIETVVLRLCCVHDEGVLDRLAALESVPKPTGPHVLAEVDGLVVAALPLGRGPALADPFRRTAHLMPLLELRAKQLANDRPRRSLANSGSLWRWSRA